LVYCTKKNLATLGLAQQKIAPSFTPTRIETAIDLQTNFGAELPAKQSKNAEHMYVTSLQQLQQYKKLQKNLKSSFKIVKLFL
jgi:Zn-dependent metalloprotease